MAIPTLSASGTTTTDGTEQSLSSQTAGGTYIFGIDTNLMVNGDVIELRIYTKILSGSTKRVVYVATYTNIQGEPNKYSPPVLIDNYVEVTLKRASGSDHAYDWELLSI
jgi:hypothetical protein